MSRVIRGGGATPRIVPAELVDARAEAERLLAEARAEAERIVGEARAEAERLEEAARAEGLARGQREAAETMLAAARARDETLASAEREVRTLALAAAARIVGEQITLEPERIDAIVRDAIARARRAKSVQVRVHPDDLPALARAGLEGVRLIGDAAVARGGCLVTTELGTVDARVEVKLEAMAKLLGCDPP